jgi:hypothetical protein
VTDEDGREVPLEAGQRGAAVLDGFEFADRESGKREKERTGEVGPQRVAVEVRPLQRIPRCGQVVSDERILGVVALDDDAAIEFLDGYPVRSEVRFLVVGAEGAYR